jgi:hypothetical protein
MSEKDTSPNSTQILSSLYDFIEEPIVDIEALPIEEVNRRLAEQGIDTKALVSNVQKMIAKSRIQRAREKRERISSIAAKIRRGDDKASIIKYKIAQYFQSNPAMAVAHRNFEELADEDLEGLLSDLALLDILEGNDGSK